MMKHSPKDKSSSKEDTPPTAHRTHPLAQRTHPLAHRTHPLTKRTHPLTKRTHPLAHRTHPLAHRTHPLAQRTHPLSQRTHPLASLDSLLLLQGQVSHSLHLRLNGIRWHLNRPLTLCLWGLIFFRILASSWTSWAFWIPAVHQVLHTAKTEACSSDEDISYNSDHFQYTELALLPVFFDLNFLRRSVVVMGRRFRYLRTASSEIVSLPEGYMYSIQLCTALVQPLKCTIYSPARAVSGLAPPNCSSRDFLAPPCPSALGSSSPATIAFRFSALSDFSISWCMALLYCSV